MADTSLLKVIEARVVDWLDATYGQKFQRQQKLQIGTKHDSEPAYHTFDAVSYDEKGNPLIIAAITTHSGRTSGGNYPSGKVDGTFRDLYLLCLARAPKNIMILTNSEFLEIFRSRSDGKSTPGMELKYCPLPPDAQRQIETVHANASREMTQG
jgi:hypothetical protein